jgi:hypothetical protein
LSSMLWGTEMEDEKMAFGDDLKEIIKKGRREKDQRAQAIQDFERRWGRIRQDLLDSIFREMEAALEEHFELISVKGEGHDDGSAVLSFKDDSTRRSGELTFAADSARMVIICSSPKLGVEASYDIEKFDREAVETRIKEFVEAVERS